MSTVSQFSDEQVGKISEMLEKSVFGETEKCEEYAKLQQAVEEYKNKVNDDRKVRIDLR